MTKNEKVVSCWPTVQQELLLRSIFKQGKEALEAWHEWQAHVDIDKLDAGSQRLLPLLYDNLQAHAIEHPLMDRFKAIYQQTWCQNQILLYNITDLLRGFHKAGIQKMLLLKGAALMLLHYKDYGLRPISDVDVFIPMAQSSQAIQLLRERHWIATFFSIKSHLTEKQIAALIYRKTSWQFQNNTGKQFDLHWHVLDNDPIDEADNTFLAAAIPSTLNELPVYALNPTDQLLPICVDGAQWNQLPTLHWIADAMMIFKTSPEIDWERLLMLAEQHRSVLPLRESLNYLSHQMDAPIPPSILQALQNKP